MRSLLSSSILLVGSLLITGIMSAQPLDLTPPRWYTTVGIQNTEDVTDGITVSWNQAVDDETPPVYYNVYYSSTSPAYLGTLVPDVPYSQGTPTIDYQYTLPYDLFVPNVWYFFTVRARDSAEPPNEDVNTFERRQIYDTISPYITDQVPAPDAEDAPVDTNITFHVRDDGIGVTTSSIELRINGQPVTYQASGPSTDVTVQYNPAVDFAEYELVEVTIHADDQSFQNNVMTPVTYSFRTVDNSPPSLSAPYPAPNQTDVPLNSAVFFPISDAGIGVDRTSLNIAVAGTAIVVNGVDQTGGQVWFSSDDPNNLRVLYTPATQWSPNQTVEVGVLVSDSYPEPNTLGPLVYSFTTGTSTDTQPPTWVSTVGVQRVEGSGDYSLVVSWNAAVDAVSEQVSYYVYYRQGSAPPWSGTVIERVPLKPGNGYDYELLIEGLEYHELYFVGVRAEDFAIPPNRETNNVYLYATTHDTHSPYVANQIPAPDETGVSTQTSVECDVVDSGAGVDQSTIRMRVNGSLVTPVISGTPASFHLYWRSLAEFIQRRVVTVQVEATDLAEPPNIMSTVNYSFTTRDMYAPYLAKTIPRNNEPSVVRNSIIAFHILDALLGVDLDSINILLDGAYLIENGVDQTGGYTVLADVFGDTKDFIFQYTPPTPLNADTTYMLTATAGDLEEDPNLMTQFMNFTTSDVIDLEQPYLVDLNPTPGGIGYVNTPIQFRILDDHTGVLLDSLTVTVEGEPVILYGYDMSGGRVSISGPRLDYAVSYTPAAGEFIHGQIVDVTIEATDAASPSNELEPIIFSYTVHEDLAGPTIEDFFPLPDSVNAYRNTNIHFIAVDYETGVDINNLYFYINGSLVYPPDQREWETDAPLPPPVNIYQIDHGYKVIWHNPGVLPGSLPVTVRVIAQDFAASPNLIDQTFVFTTGDGIDNLEPVCVMDYPQPGEIITTATYTVSGTAADIESGLWQVEFNDTAFYWTWRQAEGLETWSYEWTMPSLDGVLYVRSRATDNADNSFVSDPVLVYVDRNPPTSDITDPLAEDYIGGEIYIVRGTATDQGSGVSQVQLSYDNGTTWNTATGGASWSYNWTLPGTGDYLLRSKATDFAGFTESPSPGILVHVDADTPSSSIFDPQHGEYLHGTTYTIRGTATDVGSSVALVQVTTDNGVTWVNAEGAAQFLYHWNLGTEGIYFLNSRAEDQVGNIEQPGTAITVTVDNTQPTSTLTDPVANQMITTAVYPVSGSSSDNLAGVRKVEFSFDGATWAEASGTQPWQYAWTTPADGVYELQHRAEDWAGNVEDVSEGIFVYIDKTPPTSLVVSPADNTYLTSGGAITVSGTAEDNLTGVSLVEVSADGTTWAEAVGAEAWTFEWTIPDAEGTYTIQSRAHDEAGNQETPAQGNRVYVDRTPPTSVITTPPDGGCAGGDAFVIAGTAEDSLAGVATVEISVDDGATWLSAEGTTEWTYSWNTPDSGTYQLLSRATDNAGNQETPSAGITVTIDNIVPVSTITDPLEPILISGATYTIQGTATDEGCGLELVEVSVDDGDTWSVATGTETWSYVWTLPDEGIYVLLSRATDLATNQETPITPGIAVRVDNVAPTSTIARPKPDERYSSSILVSGSAQDNMAGVERVELSTDGGATWVAAIGTTTWSYELTAEDEGQLTIQARATDVVGNVETPTAEVTVAVDLTAPVILLGGFWDSYLTGSGGPLTILAFSLDEDLDYIELYYLGVGTGLLLVDDGSQGDWAAGDKLYSFALPDIGPGAPAAVIETQFRAFDDVGNWSEWGPLDVK